MDDDDTHRQLLQLFYDYVKLNIVWENKPSYQKSINVRKALSEIRRVAKLRRGEIIGIRGANPKPFKKPQPQAPNDNQA